MKKKSCRAQTHNIPCIQKRPHLFPARPFDTLFGTRHQCELLSLVTPTPQNTQCNLLPTLSYVCVPKMCLTTVANLTCIDRSRRTRTVFPLASCDVTTMWMEGHCAAFTHQLSLKMARPSHRTPRVSSQPVSGSLSHRVAATNCGSLRVHLCEHHRTTVRYNRPDRDLSLPSLAAIMAMIHCSSSSQAWLDFRNVVMTVEMVSQVSCVSTACT